MHYYISSLQISVEILVITLRILQVEKLGLTLMMCQRPCSRKKVESSFHGSSGHAVNYDALLSLVLDRIYFKQLIH